MQVAGFEKEEGNILKLGNIFSKYKGEDISQ